VPARTEAELARKEASSAEAWPGYPLMGPTPESGCRGHEPTDVLGGQLAEATKRSVESSARAGFPEETLAAMAQAWCRQVPSRWRSSDRVAVRGRVGFRRRWSRRRGCSCSPTDV
jgi:hypothetical protein